MSPILFDTTVRFRLLPFTHTRPVADIRCGILTMRERWEFLLNNTTSTLTESYLQEQFPLGSSTDPILINGAVFGTPALTSAILELKPGQKLMKDDLHIAARPELQSLEFATWELQENLSPVEFTDQVDSLKEVWDIFNLNDLAIRLDFSLLSKGRTSATIPDYVQVPGRENLFIEEGAIICPGVIINATTGPVYIGKEAEILEGAVIRGPLALCEHAVVKMGAKVYGATTLGPGCKVGGELSNVVFFANSNKGHDGYLGNAVIGEWCNLGADTNCSNLKINYDYIKIWSEQERKLVATGLQFCGLLMGDLSKCGINTMFNTGTVVGVSANIYGAGFPDKFHPSFSWGGSEGMTTYKLEKAIETADRMMARRGKQLSGAERKIFAHIFGKTEKQRVLFKASIN